MTTGHRILLKGFRIDKHGKLVRNERHLDVSRRLQQRKSKCVRVVRRPVKRGGTP